MKLMTIAILFATTILLTGAISASISVPYADALKGQGVSVSAFGSKTKEMICGDKLCSEIPGGREAWEQGTNSEVKPKNIPAKMTPPPQMKHDSHDMMQCNCSEDGTCDCGEGCTCTGENCTCGETGTCTCGEGCNCSGHSMDGKTCASCGMSGHGSGMSGHEMTAYSGTIKSETDPGLGHEKHQLAVLLPPSEKMYKGMVTYSASENVQLVALHGPLTDDEVMGQTVWTPDGKTKFALTLVDQQNKMGTWMFTGNALAVHAFSAEPFNITYSIVTMGGSDSTSVQEKRSHDTSCNCAEGCSCAEDGTCMCSGEEGQCMCGPDCNCGDSMKHGDAMDGKTCASCGMSGHGSGMSGHEMTAYSGTIKSETDPGLGHEKHQLAVLLPPSEKMYKGMVTYSASENVQLVALHGPLTDDEVMGQTVWTPDGKTKFALTLVDQQNKMGTWMFTGNALAVHAFSAEPFNITYSIVTMGGSDSTSVQEKRSHDTSCNCAEGCSCAEDGTCMCSGEEGQCMCGPNCTCGTDGTCQCAEGCSCDQGGACICSGQAGACMCGPDCNCGQ